MKAQYTLTLQKNRFNALCSVICTRGVFPQEWAAKFDWLDFKGWVLEDFMLMGIDKARLHYIDCSRIVESKDCELTDGDKKMLSETYQRELGTDREHLC